MSDAIMPDKIIEVSNISKHYASGIYHQSYTRAVEGVTLDIGRGETLALIGESGCGKSTLGKCMLRLVEPSSGSICFDGVNIMELNQAELRARRCEMQMIFQDADGSLNPRMRVYSLLAEPLRIRGLAGSAARERIAVLMEMVRLAPELLGRYPHELSGGQRQRVGIGRAIALNPKLIVADEPAASLDILVQLQILQLMKRLQAEFQISYLFISHDLRTVKLIADRISVMYSGRLVEIAGASGLINRAAHPYTRMLLTAQALVNSPCSSGQAAPSSDLVDLRQPNQGCRFYRLCPQRAQLCAGVLPELRQVDADHLVACHFPA